jgi:TPR repeat protein
MERSHTATETWPIRSKRFRYWLKHHRYTSEWHRIFSVAKDIAPTRGTYGKLLIIKFLFPKTRLSQEVRQSRGPCSALGEIGVRWSRDSGAQYMLAFRMDKGLGVPQDNIEAEKWLILATAAGAKGTAEIRGRIRDAVRTKMTRGEIAQARMRALTWMPRGEK